VTPKVHLVSSASPIVTNGVETDTENVPFCKWQLRTSIAVWPYGSLLNEKKMKCAKIHIFPIEDSLMANQRTRNLQNVPTTKKL